VEILKLLKVCDVQRGLGCKAPFKVGKQLRLRVAAFGPFGERLYPLVRRCKIAPAEILRRGLRRSGLRRSGLRRPRERQ
jgi:hypothetical protein